MMPQWNSIDDILNFAIGEEVAAAEFYRQLAAASKTPALREVLEGFAHEEEGHRHKLEAIQRGDFKLPEKQQVMDLRMADYLPDVVVRPDLEYREILVVAMKKEKAAFKLYSELARIATDQATQSLFESLAQEEAKHKLRFEIEYDEAMGEN